MNLLERFLNRRDWSYLVILALLVPAFQVITSPQALASSTLVSHFDASQYIADETTWNATVGSAGTTATGGMTKGTTPDHVVFAGKESSNSDRLSGSIGDMSDVSEVSVEMKVRLKDNGSTQNVNGSMLFSWQTTPYYNVYHYDGWLGFNTINSELYGFNASGLVGEFHTLIFVMTTGDQTTQTTQKILVDGVEQTLSWKLGSAHRTRSFDSSGNFVFMDNPFSPNAWNAKADVEYFKIFKGPRVVSDVAAPQLASSSPADGATSVALGSNIELNFNEPVALGTGGISVVPTDNPTAAIVLDVASAAVSVSNSTVTVNLPDDLEPSTDYHVLVDATAIEDAAGNAFAGISSPTVLNFTSISSPTLSSSTPIDGATSVRDNSNLTLNFSRNITAVAGKNLTIVNTGDASDNRVIAANDSQVTISESSVTINLSSDLKINSNYAVTFEAGAFEDASSIPVIELSDVTALNFSTSKIQFSGLTAALDASDSQSYAGSGTQWSDISGSSNHVQLEASPTFITTTGEPKAFQFNGTSQYGVFENAGTAIPDLLNKQAYTKLLWFKPEGFDDNNNLVSSQNNNAHALYGGGNKADCTAPSGDNLATGHNGSWRDVQSNTCLETEWQMIAVTFASDESNPNAGWRIYQNGDLVGTSSTRTEISSDNDGYLTRIGSYGTGYFFEGQIAKVLIYERPLTAVEVNDYFEATMDEFGLDLKTVTFNAAGGTVDTPSLRTSALDGSLTLRTPNKANASFLGWYTAANDGTKVGDAGDSHTPATDITLFARWDNRYTVSYSAGTNATGAPGSATFTQSVGAVTLPTPTRTDYVFDGWYTAASGGTKVGAAGASYSPEAATTLHGRWTQASLAGIPESDRTLVNTAVITNGVGSTNTLTIGSSSVAITIPGNAFATGVEVRTYSVANNNKAQALLPNESDFVNSIVVAWTAPDTTVPVANAALTMVIVDSNIRVGARVYSIVGDNSTLLATATEAGRVTVSFTTDPLVTVVNPVQAANPPAPSQSPVVTPPVTPPVQEKKLENAPVTPKITAGKLANPVLVNGQPAALEIRAIRESAAIEIADGGWQLQFSVRSRGGTDRIVEDLVLLVASGDRAVFQGLGMAPFTTFNVYLFSEPTLLGQITTDKNGGFSADFPLPGGLEGGQHTLQLGTLTADGLNINASVLIEVGGKVNAGSFNGVVALYAKGYVGQRLSAKVGKDWVVVPVIGDNFIRVVDPVGQIGRTIRVQIFIDRRPHSVIELVTR